MPDGTRWLVQSAIGAFLIGCAVSPSPPATADRVAVWQHLPAVALRLHSTIGAGDLVLHPNGELKVGGLALGRFDLEGRVFVANDGRTLASWSGGTVALSGEYFQGVTYSYQRSAIRVRRGQESLGHYGVQGKTIASDGGQVYWTADQALGGSSDIALLISLVHAADASRCEGMNLAESYVDRVVFEDNDERILQDPSGRLFLGQDPLGRLARSGCVFTEDNKLVERWYPHGLFHFLPSKRLDLEFAETGVSLRYSEEINESLDFEGNTLIGAGRTKGFLKEPEGPISERTARHVYRVLLTVPQLTLMRHASPH